MEKYLRHYAEPEVNALDALMGTLAGSGPWENVLVIPACNEAPAFLRPPPPCEGRSLMILVINESVAAPVSVSTANHALFSTVKSRFAPQWQSTPEFGLSLFQDPHSQRDVLVVDRFSKARQIPARRGVGHARKIGADPAASLIHHKQIRSDWIHCSDADVQLPRTYFTSSKAACDTASTPAYSSLIYPFRHDNQGQTEHREIIEATQLYELSLRYYVAGMKSARSPYAFHTIGSTMAVSVSHYAKVRGFPRREAGEDFYLLNKLAKVGPVLELGRGPDCEAILIESRRSDRVPFGTGAAVNKISDLANPVGDFRFYHPGVFELLGDWLTALPAIWEAGTNELTAGIFPRRRSGHQGQHSSLLAGLKALGTTKALDHAFKQSGNRDQFERQIHTWFDAFRSLKLIHFLRDHQLPSISYAGLEDDPGFHRLLKQDPDLSAFRGQFVQKFPVSEPVQ